MFCSQKLKAARFIVVMTTDDYSPFHNPVVGHKRNIGTSHKFFCISSLKVRWHTAVPNT